MNLPQKPFFFEESGFCCGFGCFRWEINLVKFFEIQCTVVPLDDQNKIEGGFRISLGDGEGDLIGFVCFGKGFNTLLSLSEKRSSGLNQQ